MHRTLSVVVAAVLGISGASYTHGPQVSMRRADVTVDFPSIAPLATEIVTVPLVGTEVGDVVLCNATESLGVTVMLGTCAVLTVDTVSLKAGNFKGDGPVNPPPQTMHVAILRTRY